MPDKPRDKTLNPTLDKIMDTRSGVLSFGSMTLLVGGLSLAGLLFWGWKTDQELPLWPALLVAGVNIFGAVRLAMETRARQAAARRPG
ncbi:hypothetical protein ACU6VI_13455 [Sphaerotilus natans]|uniref:hypothetical protein n=1 Tax=Sphaerotilus natans TaxID=34103 RepID=UPI00406CA5B6